MFVGVRGSILTTGPASARRSGYFPGEGRPAFILAVAGWLWLTVLFANFAEAIAEGPRQGPGRRRCARRGGTSAKKLLKSRPDAPMRRSRPIALRKGDLFVVEAKRRSSRPTARSSKASRRSTKAPITGESAPVMREAGGDFARVTGGTRVLSDWIVVRVTANPAKASSIA